MDVAAKKILLVEDDQFLSSLLKNRLAREGGFEVEVARSGDEALSLAESFSPNLIMLDIILPGKSGFEVLEELRARPAAKVPVIIISNLGQSADVLRGKELGVVDYFVKAKTSIDELIAKIKQVLNG